MDTNDLSPLAFAFLGDAIHTAFVRLKVLQGKKEKLNTYNSNAKKFCNAAAQANVLNKIEPILNDQEKEIVRMARNAHNKHSAKNFDEETYKKATSFEALIGFLYLNNKFDKMNAILEKSLKI